MQLYFPHRKGNSTSPIQKRSKSEKNRHAPLDPLPSEAKSSERDFTWSSLCPSPRTQRCSISRLLASRALPAFDLLP